MRDALRHTSNEMVVIDGRRYKPETARRIKAAATKALTPSVPLGAALDGRRSAYEDAQTEAATGLEDLSEDELEELELLTDDEVEALQALTPKQRAELAGS